MKPSFPLLLYIPLHLMISCMMTFLLTSGHSSLYSLLQVLPSLRCLLRLPLRTSPLSRPSNLPHHNLLRPPFPQPAHLRPAPLPPAPPRPAHPQLVHP